MRIYSYVIDHDLGFAPNPFHGICTLSACKPAIREHAKPGDYIIGTGSKPNDQQNKLIYWMKVTEIIDFDSYWNDGRFAIKKPVMSGGNFKIYGDNIYYKNNDGSYAQVDSFHSQQNGELSKENLNRDTGRTGNVLIGKDFAYWGASAQDIPEDLLYIVHSTQGHKCNFSEYQKEKFISWLSDKADRGFLGRPRNWSR